MDNTTKNKVIATFMGVTWYDSFVGCRDMKLALYEQQSGLLSPEGKTQLLSDINAQHQWKPEYHYSYDRLIPVMRKVGTWLSEHSDDSDEVFGMYASCMSKCETHIWTTTVQELFDYLYEGILYINQLTKNNSNGRPEDTNQTGEVRQPGRSVQAPPDIPDNPPGSNGGVC